MTPRGRSYSRYQLHSALTVIVVLAIATDAWCETSPAPPAPTVDVVQTTLRAKLADGSIRQGATLIGATLVVAVGGRTLRVRIAGVEKDARDPRGEVLLYDFRVATPAGGEEPLCAPDPDGRRLALPLAGRTSPDGMLSAGNETDFELFCTGAAQAKCIRFGYAPWRKTPDGRPMLDWYNACVRMVRGDYCGDGRHFTRDGTLIDIDDRIGVQKSDQDPSFSFEAIWRPDGAVCVAHPRIPEIIDLEGLARTCPRLAGRVGTAVCNENAFGGGLIVNRSR